MASSMDEDSNSAKNHNNTHSAEMIAETPSAPATTVPVESEAPAASEKVEEKVPEVAAVENGNKIIEASEIKETAKEADSTPKTNGNNSHSNGSAELEKAVTTTEQKPEIEPAPAKEQDHQNGATAANNEKIEAKVSEVEKPQPNGELENGVKSSEESTDLRSTSPVPAKRSLDEVVVAASEEQPAAKKLKTCEENAATEAIASEAAAATPATTTPAAATTTPQVAV